MRIKNPLWGLFGFIIIGCSADSYEASQASNTTPSNVSAQPIAAKPKEVSVKLLGPGERGNYFQVISNNFSLSGKCFEGTINGVKGQGTLINGPDHIYNFWIYFYNFRHSPRGDRELLNLVKDDAVVPVSFKVSKCSKNGFYSSSNLIATFDSEVRVTPELLPIEKR